MLHILDRDMNTVAVANNSGNAMPYYDDIHTQSVEGVGAFQFLVPTVHEDSKHIQDLYYVAKQDKDGKPVLFTIMEIQDVHVSGGTYKEVYCEESGIELINEDVHEYKAPKAMTIEEYFNKFLNGTGWQVGENEIDTSTRTLTFEESENILARLFRIANSFGVELSFEPVFTGTKVTKRYVHILRRLGEDKGKRFAYSKDITEIRRISHSREVVTAFRGVGKTDDKGVTTTFKNLEYDDGNIYTEKGSEYLYNRKALEDFGQVGKNIHRRFEYETGDPKELLTRTITASKNAQAPSVTYEMSVVLLETLAGFEEEKVRIGDTVKVVDFTYSPALTLEARVMSLETSDTDPSKDKCTLGNFKLVESNISPELLAMQSKILRKEATWDSVGESIFKDTIQPENPEIDQLWLNTNITPNLLMRWDGDEWVKSGVSMPEDIGAEDRIVKGVTPPSYPYANLMWLDTSVTPHVMKIFDGTDWVNTSPTKPADIFAEPKIPIFNTPPASPELDRLWLDTSTVPNSWKRWNGSAWVKASPTNVQDIGGYTKQEVNNALANKEGTIARSGTAPTNPVTNQFWIDTSSNPAQWKRWDGSSWSAIGATALSQLTGKVSANQLEANIINTNHIATAGLDATVIKSGYLDANRIKADSITSAHINVSTLSAISSDFGEMRAGTIRGVNIYGTTIEGANLYTSNTSSYWDDNFTERLNLTSGRIVMEGKGILGNTIKTRIDGYGVTVDGEAGSLTKDSPNAKQSVRMNPSGIRVDFATYPTSNTLSKTTFGITADEVYIGGSNISGDGGKGKLLMGSWDSGQLNYNGANTLLHNPNLGNNTSFYITSSNGHVINQSGSGGSKITIKDGIVINDTRTNGATLTVGLDNNNKGLIQSKAIWDRTWSTIGDNGYVLVNYLGTLARYTSASKYKLVIEDGQEDFKKILKLNPKTWYDKKATEDYAEYLTKEINGEEVNFDEIPPLERAWGLIAEEVEAAGLKQFTNYKINENGERELEGISYPTLWTLLIPIVREHEETIKELKNEIDQLKRSDQS